MSDYIAYWVKYQEKFLTRAVEHLQIVGLTIVISIVLAVLITILIRKSRFRTRVVLQLFSVVYSIPSLALFAILIPFTGLGLKTTLIVLVAYNQFLLVRNFIAGLDHVEPSIVEAAVGMGMPDWQVFWKIQIPLAMPLILAGVRLAIISTIGIGTIAATINAGGLGEILFDGLRTLNQYKIVGGTLLCTIVALLANIILRIIEKFVTVKVER